MKNQKPSILFMLALFVILSVTSGCSGVKIYKKGTKEAEVIEWPLPPDPPKIRYLKSIAGQKDVGVLSYRPMWEKILMFIVGLVFGEEKPANVGKPYGVVEHEGIVYVADEKLRVVHLFDFLRQQYRQIGKTGKDVDLMSPIGVAVDQKGNIYVSDSQLKRVFVYNEDLIHFLTIGWNNELLRPTGVAINNKKNLLYVADTLANKIMVYNLKGEYKFAFGKRGTEGDGLNFPTNIFIDVNGRIFVTDSMNFKIKIFDENGIFIKEFGKLGDMPGYFSRPKGVAVDSEGNIYVVEALKDRIQIYDEDGRLLLVFGQNGSREGEFLLPSGIFIDSLDRIYIGDSHNSRIQVFQYINKQLANKQLAKE